MNTFPADCAAKFRCEGLLATGSYGAVYRARQLALDRPVAVKLLRWSGDELAPARFVAEAKLTASLSHPNIVTVIDHGAGDGVPWIAYELLPGRSLRDAPGPLPWREAFRVGAQIAAALEEAHRKGILHRDIKPENVLEAGPGWYKVADFGIAKWGGASYATEHGMVMGTPAYMSPDALVGEPPRPATDVYSVGVLLHELITGRLPFPDDDVDRMITCILEEEPAPPSAHAPGLPAVVDRVVALAMGRPAGALTTAAALRAALERAVARAEAGAEPDEPPPPPRAGTAAKPARGTSPMHAAGEGAGVAESDGAVAGKGAAAGAVAGADAAPGEGTGADGGAGAGAAERVAHARHARAGSASRARGVMAGVAAALVACGVGLAALAVHAPTTPGPSGSPASPKRRGAASPQPAAELADALRRAGADSTAYRRALRYSTDPLFRGVVNFEEAAPLLGRMLMRVKRAIEDADRGGLRGDAWLEIETHVVDALSCVGGAPAHRLPARIDPALRDLLAVLRALGPAPDPWRRYVREVLELELEDALVRRPREHAYLERRMEAMRQLLAAAPPGWRDSPAGAQHCLRLGTRLALLAENLFLRAPERGPVPLPLMREALDQFHDVIDRYGAVQGHPGADDPNPLISAIGALASLAARPAVGDPWRAMARAYLRRLVPLTPRGILTPEQKALIAHAFPPGETVPDSSK